MKKAILKKYSKEHLKKTLKGVKENKQMLNESGFCYQPMMSGGVGNNCGINGDCSGVLVNADFGNSQFCLCQVSGGGVIGGGSDAGCPQGDYTGGTGGGIGGNDFNYLSFDDGDGVGSSGGKDIKTLKYNQMKNQRLRETIKKTIKEMMKGGMLNESYYFNGSGQNASSHPGCRIHGEPCINWDENTAGVMGQNANNPDDWQCIPNGMVIGGTDTGPTFDLAPSQKNPKFNSPNLIRRATRNMLEADELPSSTDGCGCCRDGFAATGRFVPCCKWCKGGRAIAPTMDMREAEYITGGGNKKCPCCKTGYESCCKDCWKKGLLPETTRLSEAETCWFGRANYVNAGYTCVARGCNFNGPTLNPGGWASINDGAGYENESECNQWMAVQMTMPGGNPGTNNPTLAATNFVPTRSTDRPAGGGEISMDRMMRESATNLFCEREGLDDEEVTTFRITSIGKNGERGESSIANKNHKIIRALDLTNATKVRQLTKGENNIREVEDAPRDLTPQTGKYFCCWLRGGCCGWERNYDAPHRDSNHNDWAGYVIEWDACCGNSGKGRCC